MLVKIENEKSLCRDITSKAVINTDAFAYNKYKEQKHRNSLLKIEAETNKAKVAEMREEIDDLKKKVDLLLGALILNKEHHGD